MSDKSKIDELKDKLFYSPENAFDVCPEEEIDFSYKFCDGYKDFLNACRTEREVTSFVKKEALKRGYKCFDRNARYKAGDRLIFEIHNKAVILCTVGKHDVSEGTKILAAHIDSPRLDLKPNPVYEDTQLALFKTHYYGGIKKYQWTAIPLALHGVVIKADGSAVNVSIGDNDGDLVFTVSDLLPHLDRDDKKMSETVKGENLNVLIGSRPFSKDSGSEMVKLNVLNILFEKYGITEKDFISAELELVPAFKASDVGFDRSMIGSYAHDDRVCAYPELMAAFDAGIPEYTNICVLTDKEEIGSDGNTGLCSSFLEQFVGDLAACFGTTSRVVLRNSECLSADVNAAFDPTFPSVHDKYNAAYLNKGVVVTKYTGARGKSSTNDAHAEFMYSVRSCFDSNNVCWQTGELGKVDEGGGGTVAKYIANIGVQVVDVGVPVLSMHAPFEVVAKMDVYMAYKGFKAFIENKSIG